MDDCECTCPECEDGDCADCSHEGCECEGCEECGQRACADKEERAETRDVPAVHMRAAFVPSTLDVAKRTVDVVWTTGARVLRGYFDQFYEELSLDPSAVRMGRLRNGAPLLACHASYDLDDVIGVVEEAHLEPDRGVATIRLGKDDAAAAALSKIQDGILRFVSVGYRVYKMEKTEDGEGKIPVYRVVDWEPYEISIVPIPADAGAAVRGQSAATNPCELVSTTRRERTMAKETNKAADPAANATPATAGGADVKVEERAAAKAEERERIVAIQRTGRALGVADEIVERAIAGGVAVDAFRAQAIDDYADRTRTKMDPGGGDTTSVRAGEDSREKWLRGAQAGILARAGLTGLIEKTGEKLDDPSEFRGLSMRELAREFLERAGVRTRGMSPMQMVGSALTLRAPAGVIGATSSDFTVLLESTLHKVLLASYATTPDTWTQFCMTGSVSDFRPHKRYRLGSFSSLSPLTENGEFANKAIPDGVKESITAGTKGNIIGISRQALINDDMSAFSRLPTMFGRAARLAIETDVYTLLALNAGLGPTMGDGLTLFHATHGNITAGAALSIAALDLDRVAMASQKDPSNNEILDIRPAFLVLAVGLGGQARVINTSQYDVDRVANGRNQEPNRVVGLFRNVVDTPRLSGTRRYIFADPAVVPTIEVAFLDGNQQPYMEIQNGWRIDGVEWKVRLDYAVGAIDFRGAITNAGV